MTSEPHRRAIGSLRAVALDAPDIDHLATFYEQLAGWRRVPDDDDDWITLDTGDGWRMGLQRATDHVPPDWPDQSRPQQAHLDFGYRTSTRRRNAPSNSAPPCCAATSGGTHCPTGPAIRSTCASTRTIRGPS
jgi:hypothetical protein